MKTLVIVAILAVPLLAVGMFGNLNLIYATAKSKQLQHRNGILVALIAFFDIISELHSTKVTIEILMAKSRMRRVDCYHSMFLYGYSFNMACIGILFLAIDRFIAVRSPIKYRQTRSAPFIAIALIVGFIYSTPYVVIGFIVADDKLVEPCNLPASYAPLLMRIWSWSFVSIAILVVLINAANYFLMSTGKNDGFTQTDAVYLQRQIQVTQSMLVMMVTYSMTTLLSAFILVVSHFLPFTAQTIASIRHFLSLLILQNFGNTYYILFWRSQAYRKVFLKQLRLHRDNTITITPHT